MGGWQMVHKATSWLSMAVALARAHLEIANWLKRCWPKTELWLAAPAESTHESAPNATRGEERTIDG